MIPKHALRYPMLTLILMTAGCDDQAARIAEEAAARQAAQNLEMARVNQGVLAATEQLHQERARLNEGRDDLEAERRSIVSSRRTESMLSSLMKGSGVTLVVLFALALAWVILTAARDHDDSAAIACELLIASAGEHPLLLPPPGPSDPTRPANQSPDRLPPPTKEPQ